MDRSRTDAVPTLVITGPTGVGKSSVAVAVGTLLEEAGAPHAVIDMDWLRWCYPRSADDPFHTALGYRNLAAVWGAYQTAGARRVVLVDVVEERASALAAYGAAIPGAQITVVRLRAPLSVILDRLGGRETGASLTWHRERAAVLATQMDRDTVEDLLIDAGEHTPAMLAAQIITRAWPDIPPSTH